MNRHQLRHLDKKFWIPRCSESSWSVISVKVYETTSHTNYKWLIHISIVLIQIATDGETQTNFPWTHATEEPKGPFYASNPFHQAVIYQPIWHDDMKSKLGALDVLRPSFWNQQGRLPTPTILQIHGQHSSLWTLWGCPLAASARLLWAGKNDCLIAAKCWAADFMFFVCSSFSGCSTPIGGSWFWTSRRYDIFHQGWALIQPDLALMLSIPHCTFNFYSTPTGLGLAPATWLCDPRSAGSLFSHVLTDMSEMPAQGLRVS